MKAKLNRQWRLSSRPVGLIKETDFELHRVPIPALDNGEILVRNIYLSLDPANRGWMNDVESYLPPIEIGEVMRGICIGVVEQSESINFKRGDIVQGFFGWQEYVVTNNKNITKIQIDSSIPIINYLGVLGHIGLTAYFGLLDIGKPKSGETLVVSAAAGAVGSIVGQIGKIKGCHVVGIAGKDEKCRWIKDDLGFDAAINYNDKPVLNSLKRHCPYGIDVYFDNVGGKILDDTLCLINIKSRIVICGTISQANAVELVPGPYNFRNILTKRARVEGFIVLDYANRAEEAMTDLRVWLAEGKIRYRFDIIDGIENTPGVINKLFDGSNKGKLIVKVSEEPSI